MFIILPEKFACLKELYFMSCHVYVILSHLTYSSFRCVVTDREFLGRESRKEVIKVVTCGWGIAGRNIILDAVYLFDKTDILL
jgi:hypothetical protein